MTAAPAQSTQDAPQDANRAAGLCGKYLTFCLADEEYGLDIRRIREINGISKITEVPCTPDFMKGVINLRGNVIPVIDLRLKFGLDEAAYTEETCIVVVDIGREVGVVVDSVLEVLDLAAADIKPAPAVGGSVDDSFILGMGSVDGALKILVDIERALTIEDVDNLDADGTPAE
ncbi:MAG: chemotaxis protein CheW [Phycisphaerae bacterium]|nr:MAG: chemotaxis protein CheW [Phycisphaerae bacterium]